MCLSRQLQGYFVLHVYPFCVVLFLFSFCFRKRFPLVLASQVNFSALCSQALEKSKYEQSLESVRQFISIAEKELELYHSHIALYGDPNDRNTILILHGSRKGTTESGKPKELEMCASDCVSTGVIEMEADSLESELFETETNNADNFSNGSLSVSESDSELDNHFGSGSDHEESSTETEESSTMQVQSSISLKECDFDNQRYC